jgi:hypothetical protein
MIWTDAGRRFAPRRVARAALIIGAMPVALWWLAPWKLLIRTTIDEMLPPGAQTTRLGEFASHIHRTSGTARLVTLPDGSRMLRLENLHATLGPQLRVWLSDAQVVNGGSRSRRFGRSNHIDLGPLRANRGNANYAIPDDVDTAGVRSVILWCDRFGVSFGAAELRSLRR